MNIKISKRLGKTLKEIRLEKGLTQESLAEIINIHPTYVGKIESGKSNISIETLFLFSRALKTSLHKIFEFDKNYNPK